MPLAKVKSLAIASIGWTSRGMDGTDSRERESLDEMMSKKKKNSYAKDKFRNRSRLEIVSNLLVRAKNGALKTHLMYGANLSYPMLGEYLNILLRSGLIREDSNDRDTSVRYTTTSKGLDFLRLYDSIRSMFGDQYLGLTGSARSSNEELFSKIPWDSAESAPEVRVS